MKKVIKILIIAIAVILILGITFCCIDSSRIRKGEEPIFSYNLSGGSGILYFGLGYTIEGTYDEIPGGLENSKVDTWIGWLINNI